MTDVTDVMDDKQENDMAQDKEREVADLKPMTAGELARLLKAFPAETKVEQATDEEGNGYSPVVLRGMAYDEKEGTITFYPILVRVD